MPRIEAAEPLALEFADFANSIRTGREPRSNSALGLEIVRSLEAAHLSMERAGDPVRLDVEDAYGYGEGPLVLARERITGGVPSTGAVSL